MVATVHTLLTSSKHVQPDEQLLQLGLQNTGANQVQILHFRNLPAELTKNKTLPLSITRGDYF